MICPRFPTIVCFLPLFVIASTGAGEKKSAAPTKDAAAWKSLFDGKSLSGWKSAGYIGGGKLDVKAGAMVLGGGGHESGGEQEGVRVPARRRSQKGGGGSASWIDYCEATAGGVATT